MITELAAGAARLRIAPALGGRITALRLQPPGAAEARPVLVPFPEDTDPAMLLHWPKGGLYPLAPYSNRIRDARLRFGGAAHALPPHPDARPHTLHGHAHRVPWTMEHADARSAEWGMRHPGGGEWPWRFAARLSARLTPDSVTITLALTNEDAAPMPAGIGLHPYLAHDPADRLHLRARTAWPEDADTLATAPQPAAPAFDPPQPLPAGTLTLYRAGWGGTCAVSGPAGTLRLRADPALDHLVVHRPADGAYLCLEPVSHVADGFNLAERGMAGTGRVVLAPGETLRGAVTLSVAGHAPAPGADGTREGKAQQHRA